MSIYYSHTYGYASKLNKNRLYTTAEEAKGKDIREAISCIGAVDSTQLSAIIDDPKSDEYLVAAIDYLAKTIVARRDEILIAEYRQKETASVAEPSKIAAE
jgi:hypothetical protein